MTKLKIGQCHHQLWNLPKQKQIKDGVNKIQMGAKTGIIV
ncbi:hypothetical protein BVRB_7g169860 [Beta vulgaris subsp. vulgaris]|nr:hypothetical protein BVRB_7g169860 [Beta vulgaris subsp. vulgaris]